jgi:isopenicillin N synthase-like dioxygenase
MIVELDNEDELIKGYLYESNCDSSLRYMIYRARTKEENTQFNDVYICGHTDKGTLTFVFQQPVSALQIKATDESDWEHLRIQPGVVAVNLARMVEILTNGYLKGGLHRVTAPPKDQAYNDRLALLYFVLPSDRLKMKALDSAYLRRVGYRKREGSMDSDTLANEWVRARFKNNWLPYDQRPPK